MITSLRKITLCGVISLVASLTSFGSVTYSIDVENHQFIVNGTATVTPGPGPEAGWGEIITVVGSGTDTNDLYDYTGTIKGDNVTGARMYLQQGEVSGHILFFGIAFNDVVMTTVTLENVVFDYGDFYAENIVDLDALATTKKTLEVLKGSGFGGMEYAAPVPEPEHYCIVFSVGAMALLLVRRFRSRRSTAK